MERIINTRHAGATIICILLIASTVEWAADVLANLIGGL